MCYRAAHVRCRHGVALVLNCFPEPIAPRLRMLCIYGAEPIKIGARPFWGRGVFILVISNINIGLQKSLTPPLTFPSLIFDTYTFGFLRRCTCFMTCIFTLSSGIFHKEVQFLSWTECLS